jgi:hypothetical protein
MEHGDRNADIRSDLEIITNSMHMLPPWVLKFFDIPALYEHLDEVAATWNPVVPGRVGMRWSETICSAAWRVLVATEPYGVHAHDRFVPPS